MARVPQPAVLALLLGASMLGVMAGATIMPVLEAMRSDLGVGGTAAGLIITTHGLAIAVSSPAAGWMVDRWGVRRPMAAGLVLYGLAGGAGLLAPDYGLLIASRAVFGLGAALVFAGTTVALLTLCRGAIRDRVMGWRTAATSLGGLVFPLIGGALGTLFAWPAAFGIYLVGLPIAIAALAVLPETRPEDAGRRGRDSGRIVALLRSPALLGIYGFVLTMAVMMYSVAVFLPQRLGELGVDSPILVSGYMVAMAGAAIVVGMGHGRIRARVSYRALLRFAALTWVGAFLILGLAAHPPLLIPAMMLLGLGNGIVFSCLSVLIADHAPEHLLGRATAVSSTALFLGQFVSPLLLGPLMAATSITTGYLAVAGVAAVLLAVLLFMGPGAGQPATATR